MVLDFVVWFEVTVRREVINYGYGWEVEDIRRLI